MMFFVPGGLGGSMRHINAREMMKELPPEDQLSVRELAIHLRAFEAGRQAGERAAKKDILHKFQMAVIGHVVG